MIYVSSDEMEVPRSPSDLYGWVLEKIEAMAHQEGGKTALRLLKGGCKDLLQEVFPLAIWASQLFEGRYGILVEPKIGSQKYDAIVRQQINASAPEFFYVEVTQAHLGETEHLRMVHLEKESWSPGPLSEMAKIGTKKSGLTVKPGRVLSSPEGDVRKTEELIVEAVQRKLDKKYPSPMRLLVAFEDVIVSKDGKIENRLIASVEKAMTERKCPFTHIYLVGMAGKRMVVYEPRS